MRLPTILLAVATALLVTSSALAADQATDMDFLKANRCRGLAGILAPNTTDLDAWLKSQGKYRTSSVLAQAANQQDAARRQAKTTNPERLARLTTELNGPCQLYKG